MSAIVKLWWWQLLNSIRRIFSNPANLILLIPISFAVVYAWLLSIFPNPPVPFGGAGVDSQMIESILFLILSALGALVVGNGFFDYLLRFTPADFAYLFPAPISNRMIVASRLPKTIIGGIVTAIWIQAAAFKHVAESLNAPLHETGPARALTSSILFLCLGGYGNLGVALEINRPKHRQAGFLYAMAFIGVCIWLGIAWQSAVETAEIPWLRLLFLPCRFAAHALVGTVLGWNVMPAIVALTLFYAATLALVFARNADFTERSLALGERLQAARDAAKAGSYFDPSSRIARLVSRTRVYTLPPFGTGARALLWANLAAVLKRPGYFIGVPVFIGLVLGAAGFLVPTEAAHTCEQTCFGATIGAAILAQLGFLLGKSRQPFIRPLPFDGWQVTVADVAPVAMMLALFQWTMGIVLLCVPDAVDRPRVLFELFACLPAAGTCLLLIAYGASAWMISAQDAGQVWIATLSGPAVGVTFGFLTIGMMAIPMALKAPAWVPPAVALMFCIAAAPGLVALSGYLYSEFQPEAVVAVGRAKAKKQ